MINTELEKLLRKYTGYSGPITPKSDIFSDLYLHKENIEQFFLSYSYLFQVDISHFNFDIYQSAYKKLTVGDLQRAIKLGILDENVIMLDHNDPQPPKWTPQNIIITVFLLIVITAILCYVAFYS